MKIKIIILTGALALASGLSASAQYLVSGGLQANRDVVQPGDLFEMSQTQFNFGTARSMSMAGAFTSLGADLSSMAINPAGLGMYRSNALSVTPLMTFTRAENNAPAWGKNSKDRFAVGNFGVVFNAYEGTRGLVSLNVGFGYNRLADFNYTSSLMQSNNIGSIADMYSMQLNYAGVKATQIMGDNLKWEDMIGLWPAVMGYKCALTDDPGNRGDWSPTWISGNRDDIDIGHYSTVESRGSIGEYDLSVGANIGNKLYIGATLGIQTLYQKQELYYDEDYIYPNNPDGVAPDLDYQLLNSKFNQAVIVDGTGVNFKLGVTYRPVENLRIGAAFHTPTYYTFDRKYQGAMASLSYANRDTNPDVTPDDGYIALESQSPVLVDDGSNSWSFSSPARMLLGVSYTFGQRGLIAVDYERAWYNGIRVKDTPYGIDSEMYDDTFRNTFKGSNTIRIGAEFKPMPWMSLRAGFGYSGSWLKDQHVQLSTPIAKQITYYSAGIGFAVARGVEIDFAYSYQQNKQTTYALYYADEYNARDVLVSSNSSDNFTTDYKRHAAAVTLAFRF